MQPFARFEFKYIVKPSIATAIEKRILCFGMQPDPTSLRFPHNTYPVTSLYFDTPTMEDYHDKVGGLLRRKKIRVRIYAPYLASHENSDVTFPFCRRAPCDVPTAVGWNGDKDKKKTQHLNSQQTEIWLEKKEKYEMLVLKKRILLTPEAYNQLLYGSRIELVAKNPSFLPLLTHAMRPVVIVRYLRKPFVSTHQNSLRITFDTSLEACRAYDLRYIPPVASFAPGAVVMEVKFAHVLPHWFGKILREFSLTRSAFSKYANSIEAVHRFHPIPR